MTLWNARDAGAATGGEIASDWEVNGISIDTRTLQQGDLFVALTAARDGHEFVAQALEAGAGAAMVSHIPEGVSPDKLLIVDDVLAGLERLGVAGRARTKARVIAVTGSVGKTSTKEMLRDILTPQGRTHAAVASYNNHWGVPLTLARMPQDTEFAVIEIGMNHPGEIAPLARFARPHVAMVTTVAAAHLEAFDDIHGIAVEKGAIAQGLEPGGVVVLNADIETAQTLAKTAKADTQIFFGETAPDWRLDKVQLAGDTTVVQASSPEGPLLFKLATAGKHFAMNGLGALAAVQALGADLALSVIALGNWTPHSGRGQRSMIELDPANTHMTLELIDDSYNANPASMAAALAVLAAADVRHDIGRVSKGRRIAFLGDMKELGPSEAQDHAALAQLPAMENIDVVHCVGPLMAHLHAALPEDKKGMLAQTSSELAAQLRSLLDAGDVVLAKGSLSMGLGRIVDAIAKLGHPKS